MPRHRPHFQQIFELLLQYDSHARQTGSNESRPFQETRYALSLLALQSTADAAISRALTSSSKSMKFFVDYSSPSSEFQSCVTVLGNISVRILHSCNSTKDISLEDVNLLTQEVNELGNAVASNASSLQLDQMGLVRTQLKELVIDVLDAHKELIQPDWLEVLNSQHKVALTSPPRDQKLQTYNFRNVVTKFFTSEVLENIMASQTAELNRSLPMSLVRSALGCCLLYVPDQVYDPALIYLSERDMHKKRVNNLERKMSALVQIEKYCTGQTDSLQIQAVLQEVEALGPGPSVLKIARPPLSGLAQLSTSFQNVLRLVDTLSQAKSMEELAKCSNTGMVDNLAKMMSHLKREHLAYQDLTYPVIGFLQCLRLGLIMATECSRKDTSEPSFLSHACRLIPGIGAHPTSWLVEMQQENSREVNYIDVLLLKLNVLGVYATIKEPRTWNDEERRLASHIFATLHEIWRTKLESDQAKAESESRTYRYRDNQDDEGTDDREYSDLFQPFEHAQDRHPYDSKKLANLVAQAHTDIFVHNSTSSSARLQGVIRQACITMGGILPLGEAFGASPALEQLPSVFLTIKDLKDQLHQPKLNPLRYNIFADQNIAESKKLIDLVYQVEARFEKISEAWPEQATPHNVLNTCKELRRFKHSEPVMKFLPKVEELHSLIAEWQGVASRDYSAKDTLDKVVNLLISWRQLELSTWARLLDLESEKCKQEARSWWFVVFENVHQPFKRRDLSKKELANHAIETVAVLESFLRETTVGQFEQKLLLIESIYNQMGTDHPSLRSDYRIYAAVGNFLEHVKTYLPTLRKWAAERRLQLEKDIRNIIQLASWKDRNVAALRQSAKSSHNRLLRIVKKYREILSHPASALLTGSKPVISTPSKDIQITCSIEHSTSATVEQVLDKCKQHEEAWGQRPPRFQNVMSTAAVMRKKWRMNESDFKADDQLDGFLSSLQDSVHNLQEATPKTVTEENEKTVKHLLKMKRRLFADTLKSLQAMGLKPIQDTSVLTRQDSSAKILAVMAHFDNGTVSDELSSGLSQFHAVIDLMPDVRQASRKSNEALNHSEVNRSVGITENLLNLQLTPQDSLQSNVRHLQELRGLRKQASLAADQQGRTLVYENSLPFLGHARQIYDRFIWLPTIMQVGVRMLETQSSLGQLDFSSTIATLIQWSSTLEEKRIRLFTSPEPPSGLRSHEQMRINQDISNDLESLQGFLSCSMASQPLAKATLEQIYRWTHVEQISCEEQSSANFLAHSEFDQMLFSALDAILAAMQDVQKALGSLPTSSDESGWLDNSYKAHKEILHAFHGNKIVESLSKVLGSFQHCCHPESSYDPQYPSASLVTSLPIIDEYCAAYSEAIEKFTSLFGSTSKLLYGLSTIFCQIAQNGFCKPAEKSEESAQAGEKLESGTGLGEGEGAEDISKDIGDDEDLSEIAQGKDNEGRSDGMENEKDAVDMKQDLEGEAGEDAGEKAESDCGSEGQDSENDSRASVSGEMVEGGESKHQSQSDAKEDMDEGVGEVNDFEPSALDEKFWDEAGEARKQEKESKKQSAGKKKDEKMAAEHNGEADQEGDLDADADASEHESDGVHSVAEEQDMSGNEDPEGKLPRQDDVMDPYAPEEEALDMPDDLKLDGQNNEADDQGADSDVDMLSDLDAKGAQEEEAIRAGKDMEEEDAQESQPDSWSDVANEHQNDNGAQDSNQQEDGEQEIANDQKASEATQNDDQDQDGEDISLRGLAAAIMEEHQQQNDTPTQLPREDEQATSGQDQGASTSTAPNQSSNEMQPYIPFQANESQQSPASRNTPRQTRDLEIAQRLGSALEKWHKQRRQIHDTTVEKDKAQEEAPRDVDVADAEFEHLRDEDERGDTQALGAAREDQARAMDERMALGRKEGDGKETDDELLPDVDEAHEKEDDGDVDMEDVQPETSTNVDGENQTGPSNEEIQDKQDKLQPPDLLANDDSMSEDEPSDSASDVFSKQPTPTRDQSPPPDPTTLYLHHLHTSQPQITHLTHLLTIHLTPTSVTNLTGSHRTGKRLNMKAIIPYIASNYKRDKIWLRRSFPTRRSYQILIALDDSKSMCGNGVSEAGVGCLVAVLGGCAGAEVGDVGVVSFGSHVNLVRGLDRGAAVGIEDGANIISAFNFNQDESNVKALIERSIEIFGHARMKKGGGGRDADLWQLQIIVSDGVCNDHEGVKRLLVQAQEERIMFLFVIVDSSGAESDESSHTANGASAPPSQPTASTKTGGSNNPPRQPNKSGKQETNPSILDLERVSFTADGKVERTKYLDTFPFRHFVVVRDVMELPDVMGAALGSWVGEVEGMG